jgi:hypothetical protein
VIYFSLYKISVGMMACFQNEFLAEKFALNSSQTDECEHLLYQTLSEMFIPERNDGSYSVCLIAGHFWLELEQKGLQIFLSNLISSLMYTCNCLWLFLLIAATQAKKPEKPPRNAEKKNQKEQPAKKSEPSQKKNDHAKEKPILIEKVEPKSQAKKKEASKETEESIVEIPSSDENDNLKSKKTSEKKEKKEASKKAPENIKSILKDEKIAAKDPKPYVAKDVQKDVPHSSKKAAPEKKPQGDCVVCGHLAKNFCASCKHVFYCTKEHQKKHWAGHKEECKNLAKLPYRVRRTEKSFFTTPFLIAAHICPRLWSLLEKM